MKYIRKIVLTILSTVLVASISTASEIPSSDNPPSKRDIPLSVRAAPYVYKTAEVMGFFAGVTVVAYTGCSLWNKLPVELADKIARYSLISGIVLSLVGGGLFASDATKSAEQYRNALLNRNISQSELGLYKRAAQMSGRDVIPAYLISGCLGAVVGAVVATSYWFLFDRQLSDQP
jgi:hypothetical protein